jgi:hypothetical protein
MKHRLAAIRLARRTEEFNLCILNAKFAEFLHPRNEVNAVPHVSDLFSLAIEVVSPSSRRYIRADV